MPDEKSIKQRLKDEITGGVLPEGAPVPSEYELASRFGVTRHQAREALRELAIEGYILRSQGRRSVVAPAGRRSGTIPLFGSKTVALALQELDTRHNMDIFRGAIGSLSEAGYDSVSYNLRF
ncbi:MAG: GntR family transcriptional regulator, histidine utilization repressor, partial [Candidatus Hydrogenedentes bacterium]|nr:GntR family transcriptional regulator, histidine utilization repressor [Candidatus Hydrogenedentota bacterium]